MEWVRPSIAAAWRAAKGDEDIVVDCIDHSRVEVFVVFGTIFRVKTSY